MFSNAFVALVHRAHFSLPSFFSTDSHFYYSFLFLTGSFRDTTPDTLLSKVLEAAIAESGVPMDALGDICVGNVQLGGAYAGPARMAQFVAGIPETVRSAHKNSQNCQLKMMPSYRLFPFSFSFLSIFTSISASPSVCGIIARLTLASGAPAHFSHFVYNAHTHAHAHEHAHTRTRTLTLFCCCCCFFLVLLNAQRCRCPQ